MTPEEFKALEIGDIVKGVLDADTYIVTGNYGSHVTVARTMDLTNPSEWELVLKATHDKPQKAIDRPGEWTKISG
ncbi:hypothetical protein H6G00_01635 [Leptolyngbya sp. FACHB-541]|uniref:hypothetical protein n=1 Tax=Leptolyngbya sp. FACHB-541 TaxID=2692810 RepID=UPI0016855BFA|nr:hypothetical protein [Leptolyngbya sp. FACHB-541]MBD1995332.1 hypothetical protein [Leptolyngbya sp. FACHB-541]